MSDSIGWLRSQQEAYRVCGGQSTSERFKLAADEIERLQEDVDSLNALLRGVGWGQGEIDSSASFAEKYEQLEAVVDAVKKYAEAIGHVWPEDWAEYEAQWQAVVEEVEKLSKAVEKPPAPEDPGV